ncbi:hypothetical protein AcV5_008691 [Taiwanofungus camphoratus]|nr:hypothetical protein AcV5_008691 [Antrodia cinnamomea]
MSDRRTLPPPPQTQALSSATFRLPPIDGSLNLPEIYDWHSEHIPDHRLFLFARDDGSIRTIFGPEGVRAVYNGAKITEGRMNSQIY